MQEEPTAPCPLMDRSVIVASFDIWLYNPVLVKKNRGDLERKREQMEGIDVSSLFVFEGSGDSDDKEDCEEDDDHSLVTICCINNAAAVDDAESSSSKITLGFEDQVDESDDGDEVRDSSDDHSGSRLGGFVGREEEEVNSGGVRRKEMMEDMENKLFWETCLEQGYP